MSFILETMESLKQQYDHIFNTIEAASSFFFLFEYLLRVYVITEHKRYAHPIYGRLRYMRSFHAVIDFLSFSPFFLECMSSGLNLPTLTWLRMLRIFRILKTEKYTQSFATVYRVVWFNREVLGVALLICLMMIVITSSLLYFFKPGVEEETSDFSSIPATFYLAVLMLTGTHCVSICMHLFSCPPLSFLSVAICLSVAVRLYVCLSVSLPSPSLSLSLFLFHLSLLTHCQTNMDR